MRPGQYLRVLLMEEEVARHPWTCFWIIARAAYRHDLHPSRLTLADAVQDAWGGSWVLTFKIDEEAK